MLDLSLIGALTAFAAGIISFLSPSCRCCRTSTSTR
jgi:hypothetical protein